MRMRKKPNLIPRLDACKAWIPSNPSQSCGLWRTWMPSCREIHLELGCGKGRFTVETARSAPDILFLAMERVPEAMVVAAERAKELQLTNVFFLNADAATLEQIFVPGEVNRIYLNFCDPWPGARAAKHRLTHPDFLRRDWNILCSGGQIHFKTDNRDLFEWSLFQFPKVGFALSEITRNLHQDGPIGIMTDYEEKFWREGKPICRCIAEKVLPAEKKASDKTHPLPTGA